ncbi:MULTISPECIES: tripartite tricarboxylate transporter substrate binding protein [unclassified Variovorax]|uniref:Bug family tripartite tricarboxylate transporter substrate binding protein n=1 Tax=unclassified Variovorax TaxID=663243 RepID=UPI001BD46820|nr:MULTISPECIES: tripartite tricarboxylate transporter substrate binding protein [unclassified Variovorax]
MRDINGLRLSRRDLLLAGVAQLGLSGLALAQSDWASKPVRLLVPFAAGGGADVAARQLAVKFQEAIHQPVVVENKAGADGALALQELLRSKPDGHTICLATSSALSYVPHIRRAPGYTLEDFTPLTSFVTFTFFLMVHESIPGKNLSDVLAHVKANPGKYAYGGGNSASIMATEQLMANAGVEMIRSPYKGEGQMTTDLIGGRIQISWATPAVTPALLKDGRTRPVAVLLPRRSSVMPEVPTIAEAGYPLVDISPWGGFVAPAGMPKSVLAGLSRDLRAVIANPDFVAQCDKYGLLAQGSTPEEFGGFLRQQYVAWGKAVKLAKIPAEEA